MSVVKLAYGNVTLVCMVHFHEFLLYWHKLGLYIRINLDIVCSMSSHGLLQISNCSVSLEQKKIRGRCFIDKIIFPFVNVPGHTDNRYIIIRGIFVALIPSWQFCQIF